MFLKPSLDGSGEGVQTAFQSEVTESKAKFLCKHSKPFRVLPSTFGCFSGCQVCTSLTTSAMHLEVKRSPAKGAMPGGNVPVLFCIICS